MEKIICVCLGGTFLHVHGCTSSRAGRSCCEQASHCLTFNTTPRALSLPPSLPPPFTCGPLNKCAYFHLGFVVAGEIVAGRSLIVRTCSIYSSSFPNRRTFCLLIVLCPYLSRQNMAPTSRFCGALTVRS